MPLQRAIATRDAAVKPFMATIESLDVSWTIVRGNLGDLLGTIDVFAADDEARAIALWREPPQVKHRYHLTVVRTFHNFLSAAVAHLEHSKRAATLLKRFDAETYREYLQRHDTLLAHLELLVHIRDFSIHSGTHQSVLTLKGTEYGAFR